MLLQSSITISRKDNLFKYLPSLNIVSHWHCHSNVKIEKLLAGDAAVWERVGGELRGEGLRLPLWPDPGNGVGLAGHQHPHHHNHNHHHHYHHNHHNSRSLRDNNTMWWSSGRWTPLWLSKFYLLFVLSKICLEFRIILFQDLSNKIYTNILLCSAVGRKKLYTLIMAVRKVCGGLCPQ